jgi:anti-anti-sigma factor
MLDADLSYRVSVRDAAGGTVTVIQLKDAFLNYSFAEQLKRNLKEVCKQRLQSGVRSFVVDLSPVNVMDSCGLSVLVGLKKLIEAEEARLSLVAVSPMILRLFSITRLDKVFEIHPTEEAATAALQPG